MNQYEAYGLSPEQVKKLAEIAATYTAAGRPTSVDDLVNFAIAPSKADIERLAKIRLPQQPWLRQIRWWLLDAWLDIHRLLSRYWMVGIQLFLFLLLCLLACLIGRGLGFVIARLLIVPFQYPLP